MTPEAFVEELCRIKSANTFNPYYDLCETWDLPTAPQIRRELLLQMLTKASTEEVDSIWIGRDLGYRGGRRTGLALTDEMHMATHADRWGLNSVRSTKGAAIKEKTAAVIWQHLSLISSTIFLWNVFPLHPHEPGNPFTNRAHSRQEREIGESVLAELIAFIRPQRLIAVGNDAEKTALRLQPHSQVRKVRHPSYGGQKDFSHQVSRLYKTETFQKELTF